MTVTFAFFDVAIPALEIGQSLQSTAQLALPVEGGDDEAHTSITCKGDSNHDAFGRYLIRHQVEREVDAIYHGQSIRRLIFNKEFNAFLHRRDSYLLVNANKVDARGALTRLAAGGAIEVAKQDQLNLAILEEALGTTSGGYFTNLEIAKVQSASLHGADVASSDEWSRYDEAGTLSAIVVHGAGPDELVRSFMVTSSRGLVLYSDLGERDNLAFAQHIQSLINEQTGTSPEEEG